MKIIEKLLSVSPYSRPGRRNGDVKAVILHWTAAPMQRAVNTWGWFETGVKKQKSYGSAHYIVDLDGVIYHCIPDKEVAYHCGSSQKDPASGKIYTDWARAKLGNYADRPDVNSPNNCTTGIELCTLDSIDNFSPETLTAAAELVAELLRDNKLGIDDAATHHMVVGWKDCPRLWTNNPAKFEAFKERVKAYLA